MYVMCVRADYCLDFDFDFDFDFDYNVFDEIDETVIVDYRTE